MTDPDLSLNRNCFNPNCTSHFTDRRTSQVDSIPASRADPSTDDLVAALELGIQISSPYLQLAAEDRLRQISQQDLLEAIFRPFGKGKENEAAHQDPVRRPRSPASLLADALKRAVHNGNGFLRAAAASELKRIGEFELLKDTEERLLHQFERDQALIDKRSTLRYQVSRRQTAREEAIQGETAQRQASAEQGLWSSSSTEVVGGQQQAARSELLSTRKLAQADLEQQQAGPSWNRVVELGATTQASTTPFEYNQCAAQADGLHQILYASTDPLIRAYAAAELQAQGEVLEADRAARQTQFGTDAAFLEELHILSAARDIGLSNGWMSDLQHPDPTIQSVAFEVLSITADTFGAATALDTHFEHPAHTGQSPSHLRSDLLPFIIPDHLATFLESDDPDEQLAARFEIQDKFGHWPEIQGPELFAAAGADSYFEDS